MKTKKRIEKWLADENFRRYAEKRMQEEITEVPENHTLDRKYEELDEGFECDDPVHLAPCGIPRLPPASGKALQEPAQAQTRHLVGVRACVHAGALHPCLLRTFRPAAGRAAGLHHSHAA